MRCYVLPTARGLAVGFMLRPLGSRTGSLSLPPVSQIERPYKERSHLSSSHRLTRTVVAPSAAECDLPRCHLIDKRVERIRRRNIKEALRGRRRRVKVAKRSYDERRHLFACDDLIRAVACGCAADRYSPRVDLADLGVEQMRWWNIGEVYCLIDGKDASANRDGAASSRGTCISAYRVADQSVTAAVPGGDIDKAVVANRGPGASTGRCDCEARVPTTTRKRRAARRKRERALRPLVATGVVSSSLGAGNAVEVLSYFSE